MKANKYSEAKAENGRLGGLAKAKNNAKRVEEKFIKESQIVFDVSIANPEMKQSDLAEKTGLSQSFISNVMTPSLKFLRLQSLLKKKLSSNQIELWKLELQHRELVIKPRKRATAL
jgi:DNA-binding Xre family transcriptional regulator